MDFLFFKTHGQSKTFSEYHRAKTKSETISVPCHNGFPSRLGRLPKIKMESPPIFSLHRGCLGDISSGRVLGCRHDASPMFDIPGSTPVWTPYMIFFGFYDIKIYMYCVLKSICFIKGTLVVSDFVLPDNVQRRFLTSNEF